MSDNMDDEGKMLSMIMQADPSVRYACVCDQDANILWNSRRNDIVSLITLEDTKASVKQAIENWRGREKLTPKIGKGRFALVDYEKLKRVSMPLKNGHLLYIHLEANQPDYMGTILKVVKWVEDHPSQA